MAKRTDIKKVLIIGSGPIIIGQAAEFDYAGTQACIALKEEGYQVILCNCNPATIMTDVQMADKVYMEPLTLEYIAKILRYERPDAIVPGIGGQTGLNLAVQLDKKGVLKECGVQLLGTPRESIEKAEDRQMFKDMCAEIGEPTIPSKITYNMEEAFAAAKEIGYPVVVRPAFTLGGTGGGFANDKEELEEIASNGFKLSPIHQVLIEKSVKGYKEIEFEVMRDSEDHTITICGMENIDPVGVHTGDSVVVAPILSLNDHDLKMLNDAALKIIRALKVEGGCNVQFALHPETSEYFLIEVNPRVSRSSALASKASGYPIARVSAKIAMGMTLDEIEVAGTTAAREPQLDYIVAKFPRFPFDKFPTTPNVLGTQMKATGEVMGIGATLEECLLKSVRSLETGVVHLHMPKFEAMDTADIYSYLEEFRADGIFACSELIRRGEDLQKVHEVTMITELFLKSIQKITDMEKEVKEHKEDPEVLRKAKKMGFSDAYIAILWNTDELKVTALRHAENIRPVYPMVDTLHSGKYIAYHYSSYSGENASLLSDRKKIVVLGAGPIRIGQGVEFDYSTVHAVWTIRRSGYEAIIINNNPETVSTDYTTADKLYFEPLTPEDVMNILTFEQPEGVIASLGGQTAVNLAKPLFERGVKIIGTDCDAIDRAEDRKQFEQLLEELDIPQPRGVAVTSIEEGVRAASEIGYPVLVRPSFVLGGRAMQIVAGEQQLRHYLKNAVEIDADKPVLVDKYISGKEVEVDAVCDGKQVFRYSKDATLDLDAHPDYEKWQFPYNKEFELILNQSLGKNSGWGSENPDPAYTYEMDVEYVRIWQAPETYDIDKYYLLRNYEDPTRYMVVGADNKLTTAEVTTQQQLSTDMLFGIASADTHGKYYLVPLSGMPVGTMPDANKAVPLSADPCYFYLLKDAAKGVAFDAAKDSAPITYADGSRALTLNAKRDNIVSVSGTSKDAAWWQLEDGTDVLTSIRWPNAGTGALALPHKIMRNGHLLIKAGDKLFTPEGARIH